MEFVLNRLFGISAAIAEAAAVPEAVPEDMGMMGLLGTLVPMLLMVVVFYFLLIRPQKKKDKKAKEMLSSLKVTDRVCTIGGIYGTIIAIRDDTFTISVGQDNVKLVVARWAIRSLEDEPIENDAEVLA